MDAIFVSLQSWHRFIFRHILRSQRIQRIQCHKDRNRTQLWSTFYFNQLNNSISLYGTNQWLWWRNREKQGEKIRIEKKIVHFNQNFFLRSTSINSIILPPTIQYCEEKQRKRQKKSYKLLIFHSCCLTHSDSHSPMTLWHFPSKNSKDSFHIVYPKFSKSKTIK